MQITVKNAETYDQVLLPVWSEVNGQDDLVWYNAEKQADGSWTYMVNLAGAQFRWTVPDSCVW